MTYFDLAGNIYAWLKIHDIDPDKVSVILRANDSETMARLELAARHGMRLLDLIPTALDQPIDMRHVKLHGVSMSLSSLDAK